MTEALGVLILAALSFALAEFGRKSAPPGVPGPTPGPDGGSGAGVPPAPGGPGPSALGYKGAFVAALRAKDYEIADREGWPRGLLTAWAAMESDYGTSNLASPDTPADKRGLNLFGIKAGPTWQKQGSPWVEYLTSEYVDGKRMVVSARFRKYASWDASMENLARLMKTESAYKGVLDALNRRDMTGFYRAIKASPFSTAPDYDSRIARFFAETATYA